MEKVALPLDSDVKANTWVLLGAISATLQKKACLRIHRPRQGTELGGGGNAGALTTLFVLNAAGPEA